MNKAKRVIRKVSLVIAILAVAMYLGGSLAIRELRHRVYLAHLAAFRDPNVVDLRHWPGKEAYRFLWLGAWGHRMVISVFVHDDGNSILYMKVPDSSDPLGKWVDTKVDLSADQIQGLRDMVEAGQFWKERCSIEPVPDGSDWWIEARLQTGYHLNMARSPEQGSILCIGRHLLELSGSDWGRWILPPP